MKDYICIGLGKEYLLKANSSTAAKVKAGGLYKAETNGPYTATFYSQYFEPRIVDPQKPGKKPNLAK